MILCKDKVEGKQWLVLTPALSSMPTPFLQTSEGQWAKGTGRISKNPLQLVIHIIPGEERPPRISQL